MLLLPTTITHIHAREILSKLVQALNLEPPGSVVEVDAAELSQFDSSALAVLLECRRQLQSRGRDMVLRNPSVKIKALSKLYGVDDLIPVQKNSPSS